jgi:hypothetical protein
MKKEILIALGITVLFLGIGIQPSFANNNKTTNIGIVENCGCEEIIDT